MDIGNKKWIWEAKDLSWKHRIVYWNNAFQSIKIMFNSVKVQRELVRNKGLGPNL